MFPEKQIHSLIVIQNLGSACGGKKYVTLNSTCKNINALFA